MEGWVIGRIIAVIFFTFTLGFPMVSTIIDWFKTGRFSANYIVWISFALTLLMYGYIFGYIEPPANDYGSSYNEDMARRTR